MLILLNHRLIPYLLNFDKIISIQNLNANTLYKVYCYTEDFNGHSMSLADTLNTERQFSTKCCGKIVASSYQSNIYTYVATGSQSNAAPQFTIALDSIPLPPKSASKFLLPVII